MMKNFTKNIPMTNITLFNSKINSEFSNFYHSPFEIYDVMYPTAEHFFMIEKARYFDPGGDELKEMFENKTPAQVKKLGRKVKNFDPSEWNIQGRIAMYSALSAKFSQNIELKEKLLATEYNILAEASPWDKKWGIGLGVSNPSVHDVDKWGRNWLGLILMGVRGELRHGLMETDDPDHYRYYTSVMYELTDCPWEDFIDQYNEKRDRFFSYSIIAQMTDYVRIT